MICYIFLSCNTPKSIQPKQTNSQHNIPYNINEPDIAIDLPFELKEASGLTIGSNKNILSIIQDEEGAIYYFDIDKKVISNKIIFFDKGDFEGIEAINDSTYYAVKSSGTLFKIEIKGGIAFPTKINTPLNKSYDIEGLAFDPQSNNLLLASKGPGSDSNSIARKIFSYNIEKQQFNILPYFEITDDAIQSYFKKYPDEISKFENNVLRFGPSGIAIHPKSKLIYIIASSGKLFFVIDPVAKSIIHLEKIDKKIHAQPEGITFDQNGTMYICNEGKKGVPKLYGFYPKS